MEGVLNNIIAHNSSNHTHHHHHHVSPIIIIMAESFSSTFQIVAEILIGIILSYPYFQLLSNRDILRGLSKINVYVQLPFFLLQRFGKSIDLKLLSQAWPALVSGLVIQVMQIVIGECCYCCLVQRNTVKKTSLVMSVSYNNFATLPYVYVLSLCKTGIFKDPKSQDHAVAFITLYYLPIQIIFFSYGLYYLSSTKVPEEDKIIIKDEKVEMEEEKEEIDVSNEKEEAYQLIVNGDSEEGEEIKKEIEGESLLPSHQEEKRRVINKECCCNLVKLSFSFLKNMFSFPIIAMLMGIVIGCIKPVQDFILLKPPIIVDSIDNILTIFGESYLAISLIITGASLGSIIWSSMKREEKREVKRDENVNEPSKNVPWYEKVGGLCCMCYGKLFRYNNGCLILLNVFLKLILVPLICTILVLLIGKFIIGKYNLIKEKSILPILYLCILVESCTPLMLTLNIFAVMYNKGFQEISELMFYQYLVSPFTTMGFSILFLYLVCYLNSDQCNL